MDAPLALLIIKLIFKKYKHKGDFMEGGAKQENYSCADF